MTLSQKNKYTKYSIAIKTTPINTLCVSHKNANTIIILGIIKNPITYKMRLIPAQMEYCCIFLFVSIIFH